MPTIRFYPETDSGRLTPWRTRHAQPPYTERRANQLRVRLPECASLRSSLSKTPNTLTDCPPASLLARPHLLRQLCPRDFRREIMNNWFEIIFEEGKTFASTTSVGGELERIVFVFQLSRIVHHALYASLVFTLAFGFRISKVFFWHIRKRRDDLRPGSAGCAARQEGHVRAQPCRDPTKSGRVTFSLPTASGHQGHRSIRIRLPAS